MSQALAKTQDVTDGGMWTRERIELVKRTVCPKGISDDEFALFIEKCKRSGMDPLLNEADCVPRRTNIGTKDNPRWVEYHVFQAREQGMLARADRFEDFHGISAAAVYEDDEFSIDEATGKIHHKYSPHKRKGRLVGAWARVKRDGRELPVEWLRLEAFAQRSNFWDRMPDNMIVKCARAAALRRAYPNAFAGVLIGEEQRDEDESAELNAKPEPGQSRTEQLKARLAAQQLAANSESTPAQPVLTSPRKAIVDVAGNETEEQAEQRAGAVSPSAPSAQSAKAIDPKALGFDELATAVDTARQWIQTKKPKGDVLKEASMRLAALEAELALRESQVFEQPPEDLSGFP